MDSIEQVPGAGYVAASLEPPLSGWDSKAARLYAARTTSAGAPCATPNTSCGSMPEPLDETERKSQTSIIA
eukprot:2906912-Amphidinium_carterae.1